MELEKKHEEREQRKKIEHDKKDKVKDAQIAELKDKIKNQGQISRMYKLTRTKFLILFAIIFSLAVGAIQPFFGIYVGKMIFVLEPPSTS